jgi:hypothetical protein
LNVNVPAVAAVNEYQTEKCSVDRQLDVVSPPAGGISCPFPLPDGVYEIPEFPQTGILETQSD